MMRSSLSFALGIALRKPAGPTVPANDQTWKEVDCFSVELFEGEKRFLITGRGDESYDVLKWVDDKFREPAKLTLEEAENLSFEARRFFGWQRLKYRSPLELITSEASLLPWRKSLKDSLAQRLYNLKTPTRHDRIRILRELVEHRIAESEYEGGILTSNPLGLSPIAIADLIHGIRLFGHPNCDRVLAETHFLLEALVESGDLNIENGAYIVNGSALNTIARYEDSERRHRDNVRLSTILSLLTLLLVLVGIAQVWSGWGSGS